MAKYGKWILIASFVFNSMNCYALKTSQASTLFNIHQIQQLTHTQGQFDSEEKTLTLIIPRDDLAIQMSGMHFTGDRGLASNIVFKKTDDATFMTGHFVLLQDQVNPVLSVALENGLKVTGLNNPYLWDSPRIMLMHVQGEGDALQLASAVGKILTKIKSTANGGGDFPVGNVYAPVTTINNHQLDALLGVKSQFKNDTYEVQFNTGTPKKDATLDKRMATNTWAVFSGSEHEAVMNGGILLHQSELQQTLLTLRKAQLYILAIYQHSYSDDPTLVTVNFWGVGNLQVLAKALRTSFQLAQNHVLTTTQTVVAQQDDKATVMTPLSPESIQNNYCGFANAFRIASAEKAAVAQPPTAVVAKAEMVPAPAPASKPAPVKPAVIEAKKVQQIIVPSAREVIARLSRIQNNKIIEYVLPRKAQSVSNPVTSEKSTLKWIPDYVAISAKQVLAKLSEVEKKTWAALETSYLNKNFGMHPNHVRTLSTIKDTEKQLQREVAAHLRPVFTIAPALKNDKSVQNLSLLSARDLLSRFSDFHHKTLI